MSTPPEYPGDLFHHLRSFVVLARRIEADPRAAFEAAAFALGVDVSVLRRRMQTLGRWFEAPLWRGRGGRLRLTEAGQRVRETGQGVLGSLKHLRVEISGRPEQISFACTGTITTEILPEALRGVRSQWPEIEIRIRRAGSDQGQTLIRRGEVDLAVVRMERAPRDFARKRLMSDRIWLATAADHPLVSMKRLTARTMAAYPLISFRPRSFTRRRVMSVMDPLGGAVQIEVDGKVAALRYAELGLGIAFLSLSPGQEISHPGVVLRDVTPHFPRASFWIIWQKRRALRQPEQALVTQLLDLGRGAGQGTGPNT